ncbi:unnamed protein product [Closterium sp. NIES-53]
MYLVTCTRPDLAYPLSLVAHYVAPGRHRKVHWDAAKRVLRYLCSTWGMGLVHGGIGLVVLSGYSDASWALDKTTHRSTLGCEAEIYAGAMAAQELCWLTYLLTDLDERPRSPPVLYVNNKAMIALCQDQRLEHITKHIALCYFLTRELQQRGQHRLAYVATLANTADVFTKALGSSDHQRLCTALGLVPTLPHLLGRPLQFDTWLDDLQLYQLSNSRDSVSLFDHTFGAAPTPPATADSATCSQWLTRDAAARLAIRNHLPLAKCAHFGQHRTAPALYDAVVARYFWPATAALARLLLPYLFPELSAFATVKDLVSLLCTSDARYRAAAPAEDHFLTLDPTVLTIDLLEKHLLAAETSVDADVGAASASAEHCSSKGKGGRGGSGSSGSGGGGSSVVVEAVEVVAAVGVVAGVGALVAAVEAAVGVAVVAAVGVVAIELDLSVEVLAEARGSGSSIGARPRRPSSFTCGKPHTQHRCFSRLDNAWRAEFGDEVERPHWAELLRTGVAIFDLNYDAILFAMYALSASAEGDYYRCVPPDPGIEAAALGASESCLPGTLPAEALHTFTLDSGASRCFFCDSTTLPPLLTPVPVRLADPSGGPVVASSSTVLPCPAVPWGSLSVLHLPLFSTSLVRTAALQDAMDTTTTPGGQRVSICTCTRTGRHLATFTHQPWSGLYTLATEPPQVAASAQVSSSGQVAPPCSCRLLSHQTLLWYHRLGHPSLPRLRGMHSRLLVSGLPRGGEFSFNLLWDFSRGEGILQSFTLLDSPQQNGIPERHIGLVMEVARTSMIHAAAPHFLWLFAVRYGAHQLNLWPCVSLPETSPTLRWTGKVGDASVFRVCGSCAFVRDTSADKLSARAIPCVFLGFSLDALGWQFYYPTSRRVFPSQDVTFDESIPFYRLFLYRSTPPPPPPLFLALGHPRVDPLPPQGPAPSRVSQVDPLLGTASVEVAVGSRAARGARSGGAASGGVQPGCAESKGAGSGGAEPGGEEPGGAEPAGVEPKGAEPEGPPGASLRLSLQQLREWLVRRARLRSGATGAGAAGAGGAGVTARVGGPGGTTAAGPGGARTRGNGAAGTGGVGGAGAGDPTEPGAVGSDAGGAEARGSGAGGTGAGGAGAGGAGVGGTSVGGAVAGGTDAGGAGAGSAGVRGAGARGSGAIDPGGTVRPRPYLVPLLQQVLGVPSSTSLTPPLLCPSPDQSHLPLLPASPLPAPSPYTEQSDGFTERREPASRPASPVRIAHRVPDPEFDLARAASPTFSRLLATVVTDPSFEGECSLGTDVFEDRQEDFKCLVAAVPRFASMLLAPKGDLDAPDIPTPRSYAKAITGPYSSQWQAAMDAEMASWKFTGTNIDEVPLHGANLVNGMWIFMRDYELHSLDFNTAFLQGNLHEEIWLRRPRGFNGSFPAGSQWSLRRPLYGLRQAPREWHDTLTTLAALWVLQRFGFQFSSPQPTPLCTDHSLSAPPSDESVEPSGPYPELVGCLMYLMMCTQPDLAYPLL